MALTKVSRELLNTSIVDNGNATAITIDSSENVGIGTTSPSAPLSIMADTSASVPAAGADSSHLAVGKNDQYGTMIGSLGSGAGYIQQQRFDGNTATYDLLVQPNGGNVGIGTTSPRHELTVSGGSSSSIQIISTTTGTGATDGLRFWNTGSSTAMWNYDNTPTLFATNNSERMRIDGSGNVAIGTTAPQARLHLSRATDGSEASPHFRIDGAASTYTASHWLDATAYYMGQNSLARRVRIYSGTESSGVNLNANATSWGTFSDERLKYDVEPVENAVESLSNLRTVKYRLKDVDSTEDKKKIGLMAQDLVGVLDEVIDPVKKTGDDTEYMSVRYTELVPVLVKAIQELEARITQLENN